GQLVGEEERETGRRAELELLVPVEVVGAETGAEGPLRADHGHHGAEPPFEAAVEVVEVEERPGGDDLFDDLGAEAGLNEPVSLREAPGLEGGGHQPAGGSAGSCPPASSRRRASMLPPRSMSAFAVSTSWSVNPGIFSHRSSTGTDSIVASFPRASAAWARERISVSRHRTCASKSAADSMSPCASAARRSDCS